MYVDYVFVYSDIFGYHLEHIDQIFRIVRDADLTLSIARYQLFRTFVEYHVHVVVLGGLKAAQKSFSSIKQARFPTTQTELCSFLGTCNVYQRLVPKFSAFAEPLNRLLSKGTQRSFPAHKGDTEVFQFAQNISSGSFH